MSKTTVQTKQGPIQVTRRVNSEGQITARHNGKTYVGESWKEVEAQIKEVCSVNVELEKYIHLDASAWDYEQNGNFSSQVSVEIFKASKHVEGRGFLVSGLGGRYVEDKWVKGTTLEDALGFDIDEGGGDVLIPWTKEREKAIRSLFAEMDANAQAFSRFADLGTKRVTDALDNRVTLSEAIVFGQKKKRSKKTRSR